MMLFEAVFSRLHVCLVLLVFFYMGGGGVTKAPKSRVCDLRSVFFI